MTKDRTKLLIVTALLEGLKLDLENRIIKCEECEFTLKYLDYVLKTLNDLDKE